MNVQEIILDPSKIHILFVVERFKDDSLNWKRFNDYVSMQNGWKEANGGPQGIDTGRISENVWLLPLSKGLPWLGHLAAAAGFAELQCKYLVFPSEPAWVMAGGIMRLEDGGILRSVPKK